MNMGRNDKGRKKARKERKRSKLEAQARADEERRLNPPPPEPVNHSRLRQVFATMSFRSHVKGGTRPFAGYVIGPRVVAKNPAELVDRTNEAHVEMTLSKTPS